MTAQLLRDVMTSDPMTLQAGASLTEAAACMSENNIGDVLVERDGELRGIVTDRDIVIRALAQGLDPQTTPLGDICTAQLIALGPTETVDDAVRLMRDLALRRIPVSENGRAVGIVSIGDLAIELDADSVLADISMAPPNQ
jgi:CBS domain-containing protein